MNENLKNSLYEKICKALNGHVKAFGEYAEADEVFSVLSEVRDNWDELTK